MELIFVRWEDCCHSSGEWREKDDLTHLGLHEVETVGWVAEENGDYLIIVPHIAKETSFAEWQGFGEMCIPHSSIREIKTLVCKEDE